MATLASLIYNVISRSGANVNSQFWDAILAGPEIIGKNIPDDVYNAVEKNLMSIDQAKNNADLWNHFNSQINTTMERDMNNAVSQFQLDENSLKAVMGEKNLAKRAILLTKTVNAIEKSKYNNNELQQQITKLNSKLDEGKGSKPMADAVRQSMIDAGLVGAGV